MNVKVKICGIRSQETADAAVAAGADFLGFNFVAGSPRYIDQVRAFDIVKRVKGKAVTVGIFQNSPLSVVNETIQKVGLEYAQLHGDESPEYCLSVLAHVIKVFSFSEDADVDSVHETMKSYAVSYHMIDRVKGSKESMVNIWKAAQMAAKQPVFIAGGLLAENVGDVITVVQPFGVDVASGIETNGKEDVKKIRMFVRNAKGDPETSSG